VSQPNAFADFLTRYGPPAGEEGPVLFVREVLGVEPDRWQEKVLRAFGRGERRISIRSAHGVGKSAVASWLVVLMLLTRYPQKTVATAPSSSQLKGVLLPEVKMWLRALPAVLQELFEVKAEGIYLKAAPEASYFEGRTARAEQPEALAGVHSEHVLLIADEASGVPEPIFEAAVGSMSGASATTLLLGNPVRTSGLFFQSHHDLAPDWFTVHVTAVPGTEGELSSRVDADFVDQVSKTYGRDSNAFRVRALGEFPRSDLDTVIPFEMVESARKRDIVVRPDMRTVWGLDVARFGDDRTALVIRDALSVHPEIFEWQHADTMETAGKVKLRWDETPSHLRPESILVDVIGLGAGVVDRLREQQLPVRGINVSESPSATDRYPRLRDELWFNAREWFASRDHKIPSGCEQGDARCSSCLNGGKRADCLHEKLARELVAPKYKPLSTGKVQVEPKDAMKKRGLKSPNLADAFCLTFAGGAAGLIHGTRDSAAWGTNWNQPVRRNRTMV
jgi:phage terminase large subunit